MEIELSTPGVKLHRAQEHALEQQLRHLFGRMARHVRRVVLRITPVLSNLHLPARHGVLELHLADGRVQRVEDRHRRLDTLLQRILHRALRAATRATGADAPPPAGTR